MAEDFFSKLSDCPEWPQHLHICKQGNSGDFPGDIKTISSVLSPTVNFAWNLTGGFCEET